MARFARLPSDATFVCTQHDVAIMSLCGHLTAKCNNDAIMPHTRTIEFYCLVRQKICSHCDNQKDESVVTQCWHRSDYRAIRAEVDHHHYNAAAMLASTIKSPAPINIGVFLVLIRIYLPRSDHLKWSDTSDHSYTSCMKNQFEK